MGTGVFRWMILSDVTTTPEDVFNFVGDQSA